MLKTPLDNTSKFRIHCGPIITKGLIKKKIAARAFAAIYKKAAGVMDQILSELHDRYQKVTFTEDT